MVRFHGQSDTYLLWKGARMIDFMPFIGDGCGNTFLVLSQRYCDRHADDHIRRLWKATGVDSVLILQKSLRGDIRMLVPGNDGIRGDESGEFCGNGARVAAAFYLRHLGQSPVIESRGGVLFPTIVEESAVSVEFPLPEERGGIVLAGGEPHVRTARKMTPPELMRFCNGRSRRVSANRVAICSSLHLLVQTFEHSINKFTGCCGTGCIAMAYLAYRERRVERRVTVEAPGGQLTVDIRPSCIIMSGPVRLIGSMEQWITDQT